jgi:23S rRNA (cytosine1962-C5)-methyltransferase
VSPKGAGRWASGHPWIFRSDVTRRPDGPAGIVRVAGSNGRPLGLALWSPKSEISLRLIERNADATVDAAWWRAKIDACVARRRSLEARGNAFRLIHGEGDGLPSLVCDRYDRWLVVQMMSAGIETQREHIVAALNAAVRPEGILARNDVGLRSKEGLPIEVTVLSGTVPRTVEVSEDGIRYEAAPWDGQKTGAYVDQRESRAFVGSVARGRGLDCFSYHGSFAMHMARKCERVVALDASGPALARAKENFARNGLSNVDTIEVDAFEYLKSRERASERFDTIVLDPPAFAKTKASLPAAIRGYKEINLRAMPLRNAGGFLYTASCSFHLSKPLFLEMLADAAADSGKHIVLREVRGQSLDHPEVLTIPETGYLKGALLEAVE